MGIEEILRDVTAKRLEKREALRAAILRGETGAEELAAACAALPGKEASLVLEAIEAASRGAGFVPEEGYLSLAAGYLYAPDNACKREASRIVGNLAHVYPDRLDAPIAALLENAREEGTVIRWASAYALSRIILLPQYAKGPLFHRIKGLCEAETENGVKNQYAKALKRAERLRKAP